MRKLIPFISTLLLIINFGCNIPKHNPMDHPVVELSLVPQTTQDKFSFPKKYSTYPVFSTAEISKKYYLNKLKSFKGIPKLDTFLLQTESFKTGKFFLEISYFSEKKKELSFYRDSLEIFDNENLNIISGFKGNEQIIIADLNNNKDFSDDHIFEFSKEEKKLIKNKDSVVEYKYNSKGSISNQVFKRDIKIYPDPNSFYAQFLKDSLNKSLATSFELMDLRKGQLKIDTSIYDVAMQGYVKNRVSISVKPISVLFSDQDTGFNENFYYSVGDTLLLANDFYKIDSVSNNLSKLHFSLIKNIDEYRGKRLGVKIKNYNLTSLTNHTTTIKEFSANKNFILLDFWGTWCVPCLKSLPNLKKLHQDNEDVAVISIALDESIDVVKDFSIKNNMDWNHAYVDSNNRKGIITDLRIKEYPTFILLDNNLKILYRGSSEVALKNIEKMLISNSSSKTLNH
ncbi:TlpA family protein disulfide reductase [Zunongwangia profunda]|mgnify:CR=1 FL=1|uniref:TlpA family protein disulfide reductase n=1 Tax=Zunongwangia profunda TaxID=398743 RepID=A0A3D5IV41_9FLAO|nr:TlpA disulfide reductase family protein [Zunongwangia profunda]MAC63495.1 peroxiredoxin [Flavobacteriaceae bacterium]MAS69022.1 peroxiredoxin [Zunongwangia sp.]MAS70406.1 peroxiredoxin [Zunongwangia sp.]HCV79544.1 TlpA family protein disulfide reductase [Zunongwangia profunda]|tara:strand:- start:4256 stop:5620 length:1365 start_codon:yes stop_codon:yes gene_type:complete